MPFADKERQRAYFKEYDEKRSKSPDRIHAQKQTAFASNLRNSFGMTIEDYDNLYQAQNGKCKICGTHQSELTRAFSVDHNHATGKIRGLLCQPCNGTKVGSNKVETARLVLSYLLEND